MSQQVMRQYEIRAFGQLDVVGPAGLCSLRPAHRRLLSILVLGPEGGLERDTLIARMWGDEPPLSARNALQVHVSAVRKRAPGLVATTPAGYRLTATHRIDLDDFGRLDGESRRAAAAGDWERAVVSCAAALALWRGPPLPELADDEFAVPDRLRLTEVRLELLERWAQGLIAVGRAEEAVPELEKLVASHPLRERLWEHLMVGRYRLGRQAEALRAFRGAASVLGEQLGIEPGPRLRRLEEEILFQSASVGDPGGHTRTNIVLPTTSFVGRESEIEELIELVGRHRLVTITGAPGVGASRLAAETGRRLLDTFSDGVWLVDLGVAENASDVSAGIAATLGVTANVADLTELGAVLAGREALVIIDDCAHLRHAVAQFVAGLEAHEATLRVLAASRLRLAIEGEAAYSLAPLEVPQSGSVDGVLASPAFRLLVDRIRSFGPRAHLEDATAGALVELCRWADGVPLALELAARWADVSGFSVPEGPARHTLAGPLWEALDASFEYAAASDREVLLAASTLAGPVPLDVIGAVCAPDATPRELEGVVSRLVDASLLRADVGPTGRADYTMLHPVREYCKERVAPNRRVELASRRAAWFAAHAEALAAMPLDEVGRLMPDVRAAIRTAIGTGDTAEAARIAVAVRPYWDARYLTWEASAWLEQILARELPAVGGIDALLAAGWAAYMNHDYSLARARYATALDLAHDAGDRAAEGNALFGLGRIERPVDPVEAERLLGDALECFRSIGAAEREAACLLALGVAEAWRGATGDARPRLVACLEALRDEGDEALRSVAHRYLSLCAWYDGDLPSAVVEAETAEAIARRAADPRRLSGALIQRSLVDVERGDLGAAADAALEAFAPIPASSPIDMALVSFGAIPVLVAGGDSSLAGEVFDMIDAVFDEHEWVRIDDRSPLAASLRSRSDEAGASRAVPDLRSAVTAALSRIARTARR